MTDTQTQIKEGAQQALHAGQEYAGQAVEVATSKAKSALTEQKDVLAKGFTDTAQILKQNSDSFRQQGVGAFVGPYIDQAVQKLTDVGTTIQNKEIEEVIRDTEQFGRTQPGWFLTAAVLLGFLAARFLKSSSAQAA